MIIKVPFKIKVSWDKKCRCWVFYSKFFSISSYGKTKKSAKKMFESQVYEFLLMTKPKNTK